MNESDEKFYSPGDAALDVELRTALRENLRPPPILKISEWAKQFGQLSPETSATTGDFEAFPYQTGIMDAAGDAKTDRVTVMKSARVGYTKCLDMITGYYLHQDPSPVLIVQPREEDAEDYSKTEIMPMIRDTPVLSEIAGDPKAKDSGNTIKKKSFSNGASIALVGANAPGGFRRITVRVVLLDEVDGYPITGAGNEGDQVKLAERRSVSFWNRRRVLGSTPTIQGFSRIEKEFDLSDQRYFYVPCPHCGEKQRLEWGGADVPWGFKWDKNKETGESDPETVYYQCKHNACVIHETDKKKMVEAGEWVATKPFKGHAGFHVWAAYSFFPNACWANLVAEWLECKSDPLARQTFYNLTLGLPYEDFGEGSIRKEDVLARCHDWLGDMPDEAVRVTCGVDVQDYRIELEIVAWNDNEESWSIDYLIIDGMFSDPDLRNQLDQVLLTKRHKANGQAYPIQATCIDSGGHHTQHVYDFCKSRLGRKVFAIKGESARGGARSPVWPTVKPTKNKRKAYKPTIIGVNAAKDVTRNRLHIDVPGPGYMHFPTDRQEGYFAQLTAERLVSKLVNGFRFRVWELPPGRANEALDCRVYAYAALCSLKQFYSRIGNALDHSPAEQHAAMERTRRPAGLALPPPAPYQPGRVEPVATPQRAVSVTVSPTALGASTAPKGKWTNRLA